MSDNTTYRLKLYVNKDGRNVQPEPYREVMGWEAVQAEVEEIFRQARAGTVTAYRQREYRDDMEVKYQVWKKDHEFTWQDPIAEKKRQLAYAQNRLEREEEGVIKARSEIAALEEDIARLEAGDDPAYVKARELMAERRKYRR